MVDVEIRALSGQVAGGSWGTCEPSMVGMAAEQPVTAIRRATLSDADGVTRAWLRSRFAAAPAIPLPVHGDDEVRRWCAEIVLRDHRVWVAETEGLTVVGWIVLRPRWIDQLYVDPAWSGRGVGATLLDIAKLYEDSLDLWTFQSNIGAQRFYNRHGFLEVMRTDGAGNEERSPDIRYRWTSPNLIKA